MTTDTLEKALAADGDAIDTQPIGEPEPPAPLAGFRVYRMPRIVPYEEGFEFPEGNMDYGPAGLHAPDHDKSNIKFNADGGGDGYALIRDDHPLLDQLLREYPQVELVESNPRLEAYVCEHCGKEYKTKHGLLAHKRSH